MANNECPVLFSSKSQCCGCSACYAICSKQAIQMIEDEEGFLYPVIDSAKCVKCGRCVYVCAFKRNSAFKVP